jgi:hypothetical protein
MPMKVFDRKSTCIDHVDEIHSEKDSWVGKVLLVVVEKRRVDLMHLSLYSVRAELG